MIGSDPAFNGLWNAQAACADPGNSNVSPTIRITTFTYDVEGRLSQVNSPEGYINYDYDVITGRHVGTCTQNSETTYEYDALGRLWKVNAIKRNNQTINETTVYDYTEVGKKNSTSQPSHARCQQKTIWRWDSFSATNINQSSPTSN